MNTFTSEQISEIKNGGGRSFTPEQIAEIKSKIGNINDKGGLDLSFLDDIKWDPDVERIWNSKVTELYGYIEYSSCGSAPIKVPAFITNIDCLYSDILTVSNNLSNNPSYKEYMSKIIMLLDQYMPSFLNNRSEFSETSFNTLGQYIHDACSLESTSFNSEDIYLRTFSELHNYDKKAFSTWYNNIENSDEIKFMTTYSDESISYYLQDPNPSLNLKVLREYPLYYYSNPCNVINSKLGIKTFLETIIGMTPSTIKANIKDINGGIQQPN